MLTLYLQGLFRSRLPQGFCQSHILNSQFQSREWACRLLSSHAASWAPARLQSLAVAPSVPGAGSDSGAGEHVSERLQLEGAGAILWARHQRCPLFS